MKIENDVIHHYDAAMLMLQSVGDSLIIYFKNNGNVSDEHTAESIIHRINRIRRKLYTLGNNLEKLQNEIHN